MVIEFYSDIWADQWDAFLAQTCTATFLHSRRFLSYHGGRFKDRSLLIFDDQKNLQAVLPAAQSPQDQQTVVSHPGATYGALLVRQGLRGNDVLQMFEQMLPFYASHGFKTLRYKPVPLIYHHPLYQDDAYALSRYGAKRVRCDLSETLDFESPLPRGSRRKHALRKAEKSGVEAISSPVALAELWPVLTNNLGKHGVAPVHSLAEISSLQQRFPDEIECVVARFQGKVVAGVVLFHSAQVTHAQYIAASQEGHQLHALDFVFDHCIARAGVNGKRYFDFGISTEQQGMVLNHGLHTFKSEFGAGSCLYEHFDITLSVGGHDAG